MRLTRSDRLLLFGPLGIVLSIWLIIPALLGLVATFTDYALAQPAFQWVGLHNFEAIFADRSFAAAVRNVVVFTLASVPPARPDS